MKIATNISTGHESKGKERVCGHKLIKEFMVKLILVYQTLVKWLSF